MASNKQTKGAVFGSWTLQELIDKGGNSHVWKAKGPDNIIGALKIINREKVNSSIKYSRFTTEVEAHKQLSNISGILPILDWNLPNDYTTKNSLWLVTPIAMTMPQRIDDRATLRDIVVLCHSLAQTLVEVHKQGKSHRDIKPENIFFYDGRWCLGDFGLVCLNDTHVVTPEEEGRVVGSIFYIADEMLNNATHNDGKKADVYSLAKVLWKTAARQNYPLSGTFHKTIKGLRLSTYCDEDGVYSLDGLLERATSLDPNDRPDMGCFCKELEIWLNPTSTVSKNNNLQSLKNKITSLTGAYKNDIADSAVRWERARHAQNDIMSRVRPILTEIKKSLIAAEFEEINLGDYIKSGLYPEVLDELSKSSEMNLKSIISKPQLQKGLKFQVNLVKPHINVAVSCYITITQRVIPIGEDNRAPKWGDPILIAGGCFFDINIPNGAKRGIPHWVTGYMLHYDSPSVDPALKLLQRDFNKNIQSTAEEAIRLFEETVNQ